MSSVNIAIVQWAFASSVLSARSTYRFVQSPPDIYTRFQLLKSHPVLFFTLLGTCNSCPICRFTLPQGNHRFNVPSSTFRYIFHSSCVDVVGVRSNCIASTFHTTQSSSKVTVLFCITFHVVESNLVIALSVDDAGQVTSQDHHPVVLITGFLGSVLSTVIHDQAVTLLTHLVYPPTDTGHLGKLFNSSFVAN